jgi:hypothetical protein
VRKRDYNFKKRRITCLQDERQNTKPSTDAMRPSMENPRRLSVSPSVVLI